MNDMGTVRRNNKNNKKDYKIKREKVKEIYILFGLEKNQIT